MNNHKYFFVFFLFCHMSYAQADRIHIAVAANLRYILPELIERFKTQTGHQILVSYAASGTLTTQIQHGAPFDIFFSASPDYIQRLIKAGLTQGEPINFAKAQLALFASTYSRLHLDKNLKSLKLALERGDITKIAIANPRHAPYGQAAKSVLEKAGLWHKIQPHLIMAENATQVMQFSLLATVDVGFVPYADVIQPQFSSLGRFTKLDISLQQQAVLLVNASQASEQFLDFLQTDSSHKLFIKHGFLVDGDS